ncbi:uncharacterized protein METZ01_LOCUS388809, partial [marine metagenome]
MHILTKFLKISPVVFALFFISIPVDAKKSSNKATETEISLVDGIA